MIYVLVVCTVLWGVGLFILAALSIAAADYAQALYQLSVAFILFKISELILKWHRRHVSASPESAFVPDGSDQWKDYAWIVGLSLSVVLSVGWQANQSIAGPDADHNGIRDDIDTLIATSFHAAPAQTVYAQRLARLYQSAAVTTNSTHEQAVAFMEGLSLESGCLSYFVSDDLGKSLSDRLYYTSFNISRRRRNYNKLVELIGPGRFVMPKKNDCK